jgi:hypothetical protein
VGEQLATLGATGQCLTALRGAKPWEALEVTFMPGVTKVFVPNLLSADTFPAITFAGRDPVTGRQWRLTNNTVQVSADSPWGGPKHFFSIQGQLAKNEGFGIAMQPLPFLGASVDPFFGRNVVLKVPGVFWTGYAGRRSGEGAVEIGGAPTTLALLAFAAMGATPPAWLVASALWFVKPYGGVMIQHPAIRRFMEPKIAAWSENVELMNEQFALVKDVLSRQMAELDGPAQKRVADLIGALGEANDRCHRLIDERRRAKRPPPSCDELFAAANGQTMDPEAAEAVPEAADPNVG